MDKKFSSLKIFTSNGTFLDNVGRIGQNTGEYLSIDDFFINDNNIYVLSNNSRQLIIYDIHGKYIKSKQLDFYASEVDILSKDSLAFFTNFNQSQESSNLLIVDSTLQVRKRYFPFGDNNMPTFDFSGFIEKSNSMLYSSPLSDSVFSVSNNKVSLKYKFEFGSGKCPDYIKTNLSKVLTQLKNYTYIEKPIIETKGDLFFKYVSKGDIKYCIFNRKSKILYTSSKNSVTSIISKPVGYENDYCIGFISSQNFFENNNASISKYLAVRYPKLTNELIKMKDSDNPIIVKYQANNRL
ncbi:hypothetical protein GCM10028816_53570 [Spirosoma lituiforme]